MSKAKSATTNSGSDNWCTPRWLAEALGAFDLDPCSNIRTHIDAARYCRLLHGNTDHRDGLSFAWSGAVYCNPPYSDVQPWADKLAVHAGPWVALLELDPSAKWWATLMSASPIVAPFRRRIEFENAPGKNAIAKFPSVLVYSAWRPPCALVPHLWLSTWAK